MEGYGACSCISTAAERSNTHEQTHLAGLRSSEPGLKDLMKRFPDATIPHPARPDQLGRAQTRASSDAVQYALTDVAARETPATSAAPPCSQAVF